eukprot:4537495-Ditylum_brightwellii.AAC.1
MSTYEPGSNAQPALPKTAVFTPIKHTNGKILCTHLIDSFLLDAQQQQTDWQSFPVYIESLDPALKCFLGNLTDQDIDVDFWTVALQSGLVTTASDGSMKDG